MKKRLYTLTRSDLTIGQKCAQSSHALAQYIIDHKPHLTNEWNNDYIIHLQLGSEKSLKKWINKFEKEGKNFSYFKEPDLNNEITSIAIIEDKNLFKGIPLLR